MGERDDESGWIEQSQHDDREAFENLIRRYQRMIHSLTYRMTGSLADAEDLAQETFIQAYRQIPTFRRDASFSSWLYRIAVNLCLNWKRRDQRREQAHQEWREQADDDQPVNDVVARQVQEALLKLKSKQRAAIVLTVYDGLTHTQAARALGCAEATVSWRVFAARAKLKRLLKGVAAPTRGEYE